MFKKSSIGLVALSVLSEDVKAGKASMRPYAGTAPWYKEASHATWVKPDWDVDYFVPNFGVDTDIIATANHMHAAEEKLGHKLYQNLAAVRAEAKADEDNGPAAAQSLGQEASISLTQ